MFGEADDKPENYLSGPNNRVDTGKIETIFKQDHYGNNWKMESNDEKKTNANNTQTEIKQKTESEKEKEQLNDCDKELTEYCIVE